MIMAKLMMLQFQLKKPPRQAINLSAILLALMLSVAHGREVSAVSTTTKEEGDTDDGSIIPAPETTCPCYPCGYPCVPVYYPPPPPQPPCPPMPPSPPTPPAPPYYLPPKPYYPPWQPWPESHYPPGTYPEHGYDNYYSSGARLSYLVWFPALVAAALLSMWS